MLWWDVQALSPGWAALLEEVATQPGSAGRAGICQAEGAGAGKVVSALRLPESGERGWGLFGEPKKVKSHSHKEGLRKHWRSVLGRGE